MFRFKAQSVEFMRIYESRRTACALPLSVKVSVSAMLHP